MRIVVVAMFTVVAVAATAIGLMGSRAIS